MRRCVRGGYGDLIVADDASSTLVVVERNDFHLFRVVFAAAHRVIRASIPAFASFGHSLPAAADQWP
jgi:hypothetical protein